MSDLLNEGLINLSAAAALFPGARGAERLNPSTLYRWCTKGTKSADGRVVRLEHVRAGCRVLTSKPAIARYLAALSISSSSGTRETTVRSPSQRTRASEAAAEQLRKLGA